MMTPLSPKVDHESFFHAAMATIPSSILIFDEQLAVVMVNRNFLEKSRGALETTIGRRLHEIFPAAFQDTALDQQLQDVIIKRTTLQRQRMMYRAPGVSLRIYAYSICPLQLQARLRGAILVMDDVTDQLKLGEEVHRMQLHLASVVESAGDLIISTDAAGTILTCNAAAQRATGYSEAEMRGRLLAGQIEPPQDREAADCFDNVAGIDDRRSVEWPTRCRQGGSIPVSWHLSRMTDTAGGATGVVAVGRNLVEQRALEAQVHQAEKLAALGMVIGGIAHEIRNPLGVSSSAAQLMRNRLDSPALLEECIAKVIGGIDRASLIVESLLRFARPGPIGERARVDLLEVVDNALMFAASEASPEITVDWRPPDGEPILTEGIQNLLELVIINLVLNAFQAMATGGTLTVKAWQTADHVVIDIGDTGPGITEPNVSRIFDPFFSTRDDNSRSGLGLSVSHSIIRQHSGSLTLRTSSDGTVFTVRLPVAPPHTPDAGSGEAASANDEGVTTPSGRARTPASSDINAGGRF